MPQPPCIVLARPMTRKDPCFIRAHDRNALEQTLHNLAVAGLISQSFLSIPDSVPAKIRADLRNQGFDLRISHQDQPQHRLIEIIDSLDVQTAVVLTPYTLLPDAKALADAWQAVAEGRADMVYTEEVIPPKFFMVLNRRAASILAQKVAHPVPPFAFPAKLKEADPDGCFSLQALTGLEENGERFLWELYFAGKPNAIPEDLFERFLSACPPQHRFDRTAFRWFILGEYGLDGTGPIESGLATMSRWEPSNRLAMLINFARALAPHFPARRETALEIGHGQTGMTAQLVGSAFARSFGVDLLKHSEEGILAACDFLSLLEESRLLPVPIFEGNAQAPQFLNCRLEEANFEPDSIDFCFSHMVLEHIDNMPVLAWELGRIIKPGGIMVHEIGPQDHEDLSHIHFEFLRHSPREWAALDKGTNLLRPCDFIALFEKEGFDCQILERDVRIVRPKRLHHHWEEYAEEDLYCPRVIIKSTKRA